MINVYGMFEVKQKDHTYKPINTSVNSNSSDWKLYDTNVTLNEYGLQELKIDLSDAVLLGTGASIHYMDEAISRFQLRLNVSSIQIEAYKSCKNNEFKKFFDRSQSK